MIIITEQEKRELRKLHREFSIIKEQEEDMIQGISVSNLHPITQDYLRKGQKMNWVQMLRMIAGCHVNDEKKPMYSVLKPSGLDMDDYVDTDGKKYPITISYNNLGNSNDGNFCMIGGSSVCFNPCKLDINAQTGDLPSDVRTEVIPALIKMMSSSTIDNLGDDDIDDTTYDRYQKGGSMLGWRGADNGAFTLTKV